MRNNPNILGIDVGSVSIGVAEVNPKQEIIKTSYEFHHGNITENLKKILKHLGLWLMKTRPPPKTSAPQPNIHIDK